MDDESRVKETSSLWRRCAVKVGLHLCSHVGLVCLVIVYTLFGAVLFAFLEGGHQGQHGGGGGGRVNQRQGLIQHSREECLRELWTITERLNVLYERNWTKLVHEQLRKFENNVVAATRTTVPSGHAAPGTSGGSGGGSATANDYALEILDSPPQWSFSSALLYSVTVITTIGFGNLSPKTAEGKVVTMIYAAIGVPLMLLCLSSLGQLLARAVQFAYLRVCCMGKSSGHSGHSAASSSKSLDADRHDSTYQRSPGHYGHKHYSYKYQRAPTSPARPSCTTSHDTSVIQLAATHNKGCQTPKKTALLATVNSSHTRGRCRLTARCTTTGVATAAAPSVEITHMAECSAAYAHHRPPEPPDIEDAEETDDTENGMSSHNTPSRIPLIWRQGSKRAETSPTRNSSKPVSVPVIIVLIVLAAYLCIGAVIFAAWENWSFLDATYFCFITLSTIGFGDLVPGKTFPSAGTYGHLQLVACSAYLIIGLVLVAMSFSLVHDEIVSKCKQISRAIGLDRH